ncbi:uncharacterized protein LOC114968520 [Acropora millepora]|uniref:uncharacterized protein LOC114968520 n=1 Tax=Acropora millepora TaxID=45264 RepID=UPI001CF4F25D|nr:uncharacterized protein LOC114968520 [Acropora millepora]
MRLTSDPHILQTIAGETIEFSSYPIQVSYPPNSICKDHVALVEADIYSLKEKGVIVPCYHEFGEFISPIFSVPKKDGRVRLIHNLKKLNSFVENSHFKMESIHTVLNLVTPNCWMASLDFKDAYYSVKIHPDFQKFFKFSYNGTLYKYTALPNGLCTCPRKFTKMMKPPLAFLRQCGHIISGYIDDQYLQGKTQEKCIANVIAAITLFENLGLVIHPEKSVIVPQQRLVFLGFIIDSVLMTVSLTQDKKTKIKTLLSSLLENSSCVKIREVANVIGHLISSLPGVKYGALYYRNFEMNKVAALKLTKGNFEETMCISHNGISELNWWLCNLDSSFNTIRCPPVDVTLYSDASLQGWGAVINKKSTGGMWLPTESQHHINYLELLAAFFALQCFHSSLSGKHVKIMIDNTSAVFQINNMGTCHSEECNFLVVQIWEFCISHNIPWLTAAHIPGSSNVIADGESRHFHSQDTEWMLNSELLTRALRSLNFQPEIDLFASRLNKQLPVFCSFRPDPEASFINAFTISWSNKKLYCFPPFSCILQVLQKVIQDQATCVVVVPDWPTQAWYLLTSLLILPPVKLYPSKNLLRLPATPATVHPLHKNMSLLICLLSSNNLQD